jgi:hypothetical protein
MREKNYPECRWVPVVDATGRRRLEMRWMPPVATPQVSRAA